MFYNVNNLCDIQSIENCRRVGGGRGLRPKEKRPLKMDMGEEKDNHIHKSRFFNNVRVLLK